MSKPLVIIFLSGFLIIAGGLALRQINQEPPPVQPIPTPPGHWVPVRSRDSLSAEQMQQIEELESIGYLTGYKEAPGLENVTAYDEEMAWPGLNLIFSGHDPEATLIDMEGNVLHTWHAKFNQIRPGVETNGKGQDAWRRGLLLPNGDLITMFEGSAILKLDKDSHILWDDQANYHHDMDIDEDGNIYVLSRQGNVIPRINPEDPVLEDFITILSPDGVPERRISLLECFENSDYAHFLDSMDDRGDIFHTNTLELLDGSHANLSPAFRKGNVLISVLQLDTIAVVDLEHEKIVWALKGPWRRQHQPTFMPNGHMLLFDNLGESGEEGFSTIYELEPLSGQINWEYRANEPYAFFSKECGSCASLPNGNVLVIESLSGRAFELTRDKDIVWEYYNPHRSGPDDELIACLFDVVRYEPSYCDWLDLPKTASAAGPSD